MLHVNVLYMRLGVTHLGPIISNSKILKDTCPTVRHWRQRPRLSSSKRKNSISPKNPSSPVRFRPRPVKLPGVARIELSRTGGIHVFRRIAAGAAQQTPRSHFQFEQAHFLAFLPKMDRGKPRAKFQHDAAPEGLYHIAYLTFLGEFCAGNVAVLK